MPGIVRYGTYVPFFRLQRSAMGGGKGERAVASYDEDASSMAVEASREALRDADESVDSLLLATTSAPYAEKLNAATVQAALNLPASLNAMDVSGSTRAGASALLAALDMASANRPTLVAASDVVVGAPSGPRELGGGDGACAFVIGPGDGVAKLRGSASLTEETLDVWRTPSMPFAKQWEERFGEATFVPLIAEAFTAALESAGIEASALSKVVADGTNVRAIRSFLRRAGLQPEQVADTLGASVGRTGAAAAGLALANVLDTASAGDLVAVISAADGVDVLVFEVTDEISSRRPRHGVVSWVDSKRNDLPYLSYLKWREILDFEPPRRPDPQGPAAPPMQRADRWKFGFVGAKCRVCGAVNLPPQRVCVVCQATDEMDPVPYADAQCKVATYTIDRLAYSLQPPTVAAVVDFADGGRFNCQLTDVDPDAVGIGDELEMTFRRFFTAGGVHNYFWKARPRR